VETQYLRDFVTLSEELHFSRAAGRLHIAQPALSQHISRLERMWGGDLFSRAGHRVNLTPFGEIMLVQARHILDDCEAASEVARRAAAGQIGMMSIGLANAVDPSWFDCALKALHGRYPDLAITVLEMPSADIVQAVRAHRLDFGIVWLPIDASGLRSTLLLREEQAAVLPLNHPLTALAAIPMRAFDNEPVVTIPRLMNAEHYDFVVGLFRDAGAVPRIQHESFTVENNLAMTRAGLGISIVPMSYLAITKPDGVAVRPICDPAMFMEVGMVTRLDGLTQPAEAFRTLLQNVPSAAALSRMDFDCPAGVVQPARNR
jgi:DNA-binding transcriptional LysR family regulator